VFDYALKHRFCSSQQSFNELLRNACPNYVGNASTLSKLKSGVSVGDRTLDQLKEALDAFCKDKNINIGSLPERDEDTRFKKDKLRLMSVPSSLVGDWLFVQYRSVRKNPKNIFPEDGYRTAVLTYGRDSKKKRDITIVGESTGWLGHVHMLDSRLYYFANEYLRPDTIRESAFFITFPPFDGADNSIQNGIVLGISRGRYEHHAPPVYASRIMLRRLPSAVCPPDRDSKFLRRQFCGYFGTTVRQKQNVDKDTRQFLSETFQLFKKAGESPHSKGDHIFVNPHF